MKKILIIILFFLSIFSIYSEDPWENEDLLPLYTLPVEKSVDSMVLSFIYFYKKGISPFTVDRCPFYISCSSYAVKAIKKYGTVIGLLYFIDRFFYRENYAAYIYYPLKETAEGVYKLDDNFFLE